MLSKALGYQEDAKLLIIHADDAGLSHSENRATIETLENGMVNSYSIMAPCPRFYEMAIFAKNNPCYDYGVHLTLTCEWNNFKFGPVLSHKEVPSLVDEQGYFFKDRHSLIKNARIDDLRKELVAQVDRAIDFGLQPSHLDSHMYSLGASKEFLDLYREIGEAYSLPILLNADLINQVSGINPKGLDLGKTPYVNQIYIGNFEIYNKGNLASYYTKSLQNLKPGLNVILIHPAFDDPEMKSITMDHPNFGSAWRQIDLEFFTSQICKNVIKDAHLKLITWKEIKDVIYT